jgi:uncharacterized RmlC-like cupin family protein
MVSDSVPASALTFSAHKVSLYAELIVMLPDSTERSHRHAQRLTDMYAVSGYLMQQDIVSVL